MTVIFKLFCALVIISVTVTGAFAENKKPVLIYHSLSGLSAAEKQPALLTLYPDGHIIANSPSGLEKKIESTLSPQQSQELLAKIIGEYHFFDIDTQSIQKQIAKRQKRTGQLFAIMDASITKVQLRQHNRQKIQQFYGLSSAAKQYPSINQLSDLAAIENQLQYTRHWLLAGKDKGLLKELAVANQVLQQQYPYIAPLTRDTLSMVSLPANGNRNIHFQRVQLDKNNSITHYLGVYNQYSKNGELKVIVNLTPY